MKILERGKIYTYTKMAFIAGAGFGGANVAFSSKTVAARRAVAASVNKRSTVVKMAENYPKSEVLGLGKNIPSSLYVLISIACFAIGVTSVAKSNLLQPLSPDSINPQFVLGSLMLPISWGAHTAAFIQKVNKK